MKKGIVLSSGGIDSTTCLALAINHLGLKHVASVSVKYGQKHLKELDYAKKIAKFYNIPHYIIDLSNAGIFEHSNSSLLQHSHQELKSNSYKNQIEQDGIVNSYVPFRNGLILSAVSSLALSIYPEEEIKIYLGAHADDEAGTAYADCSPKFTKAMARAIKEGTYKKVSLESPLITFNKTEVIALGLALNAPYHFTWSCYEGGEIPCGKCGTCLDRQLAFEKNNILDPFYEFHKISI